MQWNFAQGFAILVENLVQLISLGGNHAEFRIQGDPHPSLFLFSVEMEYIGHKDHIYVCNIILELLFS